MKIEKMSFVYEDAEYEFEMRDRISFTEMVTLCRDVVGDMFNDGRYFPEWRDFSMWKKIIRAYTNIPLFDESKEADGMDKNYELIFGSNVCDVIRSFAGEQIDRQIEEYIDKIEQSMLNKSKLDMFIEEVLDNPDVTNALAQLGAALPAREQKEDAEQQ